MSRWSLYVGLAAVVCGLSLAAGCAGTGRSPLANSPLAKLFSDPLGRRARDPLRQQPHETARGGDAERLADSADDAGSPGTDGQVAGTQDAGAVAAGGEGSTQELIEQELRDAPPQERSQLIADLRGLDDAVVRNILKVRRVARQFGRGSDAPTEPGHSHVRPGGDGGANDGANDGANGGADAAGSDVRLVAGQAPPAASGAEGGAAGHSSGVSIMVPRDPYADVPGRVPAADPGLGGADPWGRAAAFPPDPAASGAAGEAAVTSLPPAPRYSAADGPRNPVELSPEPFIQRPLAGGPPEIVPGSPAGSNGSNGFQQQAGFRGAPAGPDGSQYGRLPGEPYRSAAPVVRDYSAQGGDPFARPPVQIASNDPNQQIPGALAGGPEGGTANPDWSGDLLQVIARMEASLGQTRYADLTSADEKTRFIERHVFLRMLYLMVGREERALAAIPDVPAADREFWQQVFWGLSSYFDSAVMPEEDYRAAQAVAQLRAAIERLQQKAQLELRNVAFCHKVSNFGSYERFERDEFRPGQPVLLYAELVNFTSRMNADGLYHTRLKSTVEFSRPGPGGEVVERLEFPVTEDLCHSHRRDYFHSYEFAIPPRLALGPHVLTLSVEDELGQKVATYRLNFTVN